MVHSSSLWWVNRRLVVGLGVFLWLGLGAGVLAAEPGAEPAQEAEALVVPRSLDTDDLGDAGGVWEEEPAAQMRMPTAPESAEELLAQTLGQKTTNTGQSWRVQPAAQPPIQVRRAVALVQARAEQVATSIAHEFALAPEHDPVDDGPQLTVAEPFAPADGFDDSDLLDEEENLPGEELVLLDEASDTLSRRILERLNPVDLLADQINFRRVRRFAGQVLSQDGPHLVMSPYVSDPRWFQAMKLLKADQCDQAYELATAVVGKPSDGADATMEPAVRYAVARIQMCTRAHAAEGKKALEGLARGDFGTVSQLARLRLGLPAGHDSFAEDEALHLRARIRQAMQLAQKGHIEDALNDLLTLGEQQARGWNQYECDSARVDILEKAGRLEEATALMLEIYRTARTWTIGDRVEARLAALEKRAKTKFFDFGERVDRMREYIQRGQFKKARDVSVENAKLRGVAGNEIRGWGLMRQAMEAEQRRDRKKAAELYAQADQLIKDPAVRPRLYVGWAKALRRLDRDPEAIALYDRLCAEFPGHILCADALFEAGRLSQYAELHAQARERFGRVIQEYPGSDKVPNALWGLAFSAYLMQDYAAMQQPLERLMADFGNLQDSSELTMGLKAQYWLGVAALKGGEEATARRALQATIDQGPLTWYGRLAVARMKSAGMRPVVRLPNFELSLGDLKTLATLRVPDNPRFYLAAEFARLGLYPDAIAALREQASVYPKPPRAQEFLAAIYLADDNPAQAHWIMKRQLDQSQVTQRTMRDWGVAFPMDYMEISHKYGTQYNVSPFLVQAIIRQESGFRPSVSSPAGAVGLMQLMPGTARYTQRVFLDEGGALSHAQMIVPETNIRLGTMYIRAQTAFASERVALALAGYNAGPAPLQDWFARFGTRELDAWVESITYREARGYVRKVFTSYITYAGIYGGVQALPDIELEMPTSLRAWGDIPEVKRIKEGEPISQLDLTIDHEP